MCGSPASGKQSQAFKNAADNLRKAMAQCERPESKSLQDLEKLIEMLGGAIETAEGFGVDESLVSRGAFAELGASYCVYFFTAV